MKISLEKILLPKETLARKMSLSKETLIPKDALASKFNIYSFQNFSLDWTLCFL